MSIFNFIYSTLPLSLYYSLDVEVFKTPPNFSTASTAALEAPVTKIFNLDVAVPLAKILTHQAYDALFLFQSINLH